MVGDSPSDIEAGHRAGTFTVRIAQEPDANADMTFATLLEFAHFLESKNGPTEEHATGRRMTRKLYNE